MLGHSGSAEFLMRLESGEVADCSFGWQGWEARFYGTKTRAEIMFSKVDWQNFGDESYQAEWFEESTTSRALRQDLDCLEDDEADTQHTHNGGLHAHGMWRTAAE